MREWACWRAGLLQQVQESKTPHSILCEHADDTQLPVGEWLESLMDGQSHHI